MVKLVCFLKRREGLSLEHFYEHWEQRHAALITSTEPFSSLVRRYEQHRRADAPAWMGSAGFDAMAIQWFDSTDDIAAFVSAPQYAELIAPDEELFLDRSGLVWFVAGDAEVPVPGPIIDRGGTS